MPSLMRLTTIAICLAILLLALLAANLSASRGGSSSTGG